MHNFDVSSLDHGNKHQAAVAAPVSNTSCSREATTAAVSIAAVARPPMVELLLCSIFLVEPGVDHTLRWVLLGEVWSVLVRLRLLDVYMLLMVFFVAVQGVGSLLGMLRLLCSLKHHYDTNGESLLRKSHLTEKMPS